MDYGQIAGMQSVNPQLASLQNQLQTLFQNYNQLNKNMPQSPMAPAQQNTSLTVQFVYGLDGANNFLKSMGPNTSAAVFDHDEPIFYMLSVDANGVPAKIKIGRFTLEDAPEPESDVITKKDFEAFRNEIRSWFVQNNQINGGMTNESNS